MRLQTFSSQHYVAPLPPGHPFPMLKFPVSAGLVAEFADVVDPGTISDADLLRVHTADYVRSIRTGEYNDITRQRLGLPWSPELCRRSHAATAGTLAAARVALRQGFAANLAGGTHHAFADRGEGYCVFNDVAVAVRALLADDPMYRFVVLDLDAHQGNGTHSIFEADRRVFTYSIHGGRNYPSIKVPGCMDVEMPRFVSGTEYLDALRRTLPEAVERADADLAFVIAGADVHENDRFGQMGLNTGQCAERDTFALNLLAAWNIPAVVVYGGGYNRTWGMTAQLHAQTVHVAAGFFARRHGLPEPQPPAPAAEWMTRGTDPATATMFA